MGERPRSMPAGGGLPKKKGRRASPGGAGGTARRRRAEGRTADADNKKIGVLPALFRSYFATVHSVAERSYVCQGRDNHGFRFMVRRQVGGAEPVVSHHPPLVLIGQTAAFKVGHFTVGTNQQWFHGGEIIVREAHGADVQHEPDFRVVVQVVFEAFPICLVVHGYLMFFRCRPARF